jgi:signal transduction histidine kinase
MNTHLATSTIRTEEDVVAVRQQAREIAGALGFDANDLTRIATAVSEIARNAYHYGGGGSVEFSHDPDGAKFSITVRDEGPGIRDLKTILNGSYESKTGMGLGLVGARRLMDDFHIESVPGKGTIVMLVKELPPKTRPLTEQRLQKIATQIAKTAKPSVLDELRSENRELLRLMDELRARQEELARLNSELEDTNRGVVALYAELDEKAERLRRGDQMKTRFLRHMSHEFRTPLSSILALSRLLLDEGGNTLNSEQVKQVGFIRKSAESLLELVNDLLDLARVEAGKSIVRAASFSVASLFGALRGVLRPLRSNEAVDLVFEDPSGLPPMFTDEAKLSQILRNFIANALKFTERGEVRVSARIIAPGMVQFAVSDTGIGIEPDHLDSIFQEFVQVDTHLQSKFKGTGLGLSLSKALAELLGGRVRVESTVAKGSTFFAEVPLNYGAESSAADTQCEVLLIDDEEVSRYLIRQALGPGIQVEEASDGMSGLQRARECHPAAILLDLRMTDMDGFEVLRRLKSEPKTRDIRVVVLTSQLLTPEDRAILEPHSTAILSKEVLYNPRGGEILRGLLKGNSGTAWEAATRT